MLISRKSIISGIDYHSIQINKWSINQNKILYTLILKYKNKTYLTKLPVTILNRQV